MPDYRSSLNLKTSIYRDLGHIVNNLRKVASVLN